MSGPEQTVPSDNPDNYCRLCFSDRNLVALFPSDAEPRQFLLDQISHCTGIRIEEVENYPRSICWRCAVALEDYQLFRERSLAHDAIIKKKYSTSTVNVTSGNTEWVISIPASEIPSQDGGEAVEKDDKSLIEPMAAADSDSSSKHGGFSSRKMNELNKDDPQSSKSTTCNLCKHEFVSRQSLYSHFKEQHSDRGRPHKCDLCPASFKRRSHLEDHVSSHTGEVRYDCKECGAKYAKAKSLIRHRKMAHSTVPPTAKVVNKTGLTGGDFQCKYCPKSFKHRPSLNFHIKSHYEMLPHVCQICSARFANAKGLQVHNGRYHPTDIFKPVTHPLPPSSKEPPKSIQCTLCPRFFEQRRYLTQHMKFIHPNCSEEIAEGERIAEQQQTSKELGTDGQIQADERMDPVTIKFEVEDNDSMNGADVDYS